MLSWKLRSEQFPFANGDFVDTIGAAPAAQWESAHPVSQFTAYSHSGQAALEFRNDN